MLEKIDTYRDHFHALAGKIFCCRLRSVAGDPADLELLGESGIRENMLDDGAALVACGAEYSYEFRHLEVLMLMIGFCR